VTTANVIPLVLRLLPVRREGDQQACEVPSFVLDLRQLYGPALKGCGSCHGYAGLSLSAPSPGDPRLVRDPLRRATRSRIRHSCRSALALSYLLFKSGMDCAE
jgi:hypothetical protein